MRKALSKLRAPAFALAAAAFLVGIGVLFAPAARGAGPSLFTTMLASTANAATTAQPGVMQTAQVLNLNELVTPTTSRSMNNQKITNLLDPTLAQDGATKNYVDTRLVEFAWGALGVPGATGDRWLYPGGSPNAPFASAVPSWQIAARAYTCTTIAARIPVAVATGNLFTFQINSSDTALNVTVPSSQTTWAVTTGASISVAAGDLVSIKINEATAVASANAGPKASVLCKSP